MEEKKRYSDEELVEFRELINEKLRVAKEQYEEVIATLNKRNSNDIDDTLPTYHALEEGSTVQSLEELMNSAERLRKFITGLQAALMRIENKTYGICPAPTWLRCSKWHEARHGVAPWGSTAW